MPLRAPGMADYWKEVHPALGELYLKTSPRLEF